MTRHIGLRVASHRCGLAAVRQGHRRLRLVVLPWPWRPAAGPTGRALPWEEDALHIVAHEGDLLSIEVPDEEAEAVIEALLRGPDEPLRLVERADPLPDLRPSPGPPIDEALLQLLLLVARVGPRMGEAGSRLRSPLLAPLLHARLVDVLGPRLPLLRRGYVEHSEALGQLRGRLEVSRSAVALGAGLPLLHTRFDELSAGTPLLQVLRAALAVVARGSILGDAQAARLCQDGRPPRQSARALLRALPAAEPLSIGAARSLGARLRLSSMEHRAWGPVLEAARDVLFGLGPALSPLDRSSPEIWVLDSALAWERLLLQALQTRGVRVEAQLPLPPPWSVPGLLPRRADLVVHPGPLLLDAKYAPLEGPPPAEHLAQVHAYGRLLPAAVVGLVYAGPAWAPARREGPWPALDPGGGPLPLHLHRLPFPAPDDLGAPGDLLRWARRTGGRLIAGQSRAIVG